MSDEENILSRWSRRKRDAAAEVADAPAPPPDAEGGGARAVSELPQPITPLNDLETLPSLDSITAATDIRAFLAPGVPAHLTREALRRAWSADPAIRDFIGLSENSWDFNDPTAMGGFGPLQMTDGVRRALAQLFTPTEPTATEPKPTAGKVGPSTDPAASAKDTEDTVRILQSGQDEFPEPTEEITAASDVFNCPTNIAAAQNPVAPDDPTPSTGRRSHGGALPK